MADQDRIYHRLFDHPEMVAQLLREFVAGPWLDDLDLDSMTRENAKFHAATGDRREGDMVWRIPRRDGGGETYLMLLLEFQSTSDRWMALRVLVYASLLWQHLVNEKRLPPDGRLPPILPVVLYNGDRRWAAPLTLHDLVGLPAIHRYGHGSRRCVINWWTKAPLPRMIWRGRDALLALLFRLESSPDPAQVVVLTDAVLAWFRRHPGFEALRSVFAEMLGAILAPLAPDVRVPEELLEMRNMLATRGRDLEAAMAAGGRAERPSEQKAARKASRKAVSKVRRPCCCACWSAASAHCRVGRAIASPPPTSRRWRNGACGSSTAASLDEILA